MIRNVLIKLYYLVLRVTVLVTLVVPLDLVVRVTLVVVFPLLVTFTVLRVTCAIILKFYRLLNYYIVYSIIFDLSSCAIFSISYSCPAILNAPQMYESISLYVKLSFKSYKSIK